MVKDDEQQLAERRRTTTGQEGYGKSTHAAEDLTDGDFLTEVVTQYAERATQAGGKV